MVIIPKLQPLITSAIPWNEENGNAFKVHFNTMAISVNQFTNEVKTMYIFFSNCMVRFIERQNLSSFDEPNILLQQDAVIS